MAVNSHWAKTVAAVIAAPMIAVFVTGLILAMGGYLEEERLLLALALFAAVLYGIPGTMIVGLPVHALLLAMRWTGCRSYAIAGGACGFLYVAGIYCLMLLDVCLGDSGRPTSCWDSITVIGSYMTATAPIIVASPITAVCFWLIRRPDLDRVSMASTPPDESAAAS
jgi:hypothetical protein